ncbi:MAG TPA: TonB-dependent receptor, partial [Allosphingosinicella sp.]|nr:TonB-dependent receptor [Allosphingosinicella sp.]
MQTGYFRTCSSFAALAFCLLASGVAPAQSGPGQPAPAEAAPAKPSSDRPQQITVTGTRSEVNASPDRVSFNVANDLQVQTGTLADALRAVPGVEVDVQGRVSLRGDPGVEILIDGRPSALLRGDSRGDAILSMPAGRIERVEVMTNASAAYSPEGSGGVINLVTRRAPQNSRSGTARATIGTRGSGGLNLSGSHSASGLTLTGDAGYRRMRGEASATQLRARLNPVTASFLTSELESELDNANSFRTARVGAEYDLDKANRLSTDFNYREGRSEVDRTDDFVSQNAAASYDRVSDIGMSQRGLGARASWRRTLPGKDHEFVADVEAEKLRMKRDVDAVTTFASGGPGHEDIGNRIRRTDYNAKLDYKKGLGEGSSLNLGYQANLADSGFNSFGSRGSSLDALLPVPALTNRFEYGQSVHALYGTYRFDLGKLDTQAGLRLEQVDTRIDQITDGAQFENDYFRAYPTLHLSYGLTATQQLRGSFSRRVQRPSPQDLNPYTIYIDPQNLRRGNPFLLPEVTDAFELAWQRRQGGTFYSVTGFYRRSSGGVTDILSDVGNGIFLTSRANLATAKRAGVELIANGKLSKTLSYNASGTLLWNEIDPRLGGFFTPRSGATGNARANLSWQPTPKDFFQLNGFYSGKQLLPQGYRLSSGVLNLGYRRKIDERLSLLATAQNILD